MNRNILILFICLACLFAASALIISGEKEEPVTKEEPAVKEEKPETAPVEKAMNDQEKKSYIIGLTIGQNLKQNLLKQLGVELQTAFILKGLEHGITGIEPLVTKDEVAKINQQIMQEMQNRQETNQKEKAMENLEKGFDRLETYFKDKT